MHSNNSSDLRNRTKGNCIYITLVFDSSGSFLKTVEILFHATSLHIEKLCVPICFPLDNASFLAYDDYV